MIVPWGRTFAGHKGRGVLFCAVMATVPKKSKLQRQVQSRMCGTLLFVQGVCVWGSTYLYLHNAL